MCNPALLSMGAQGAGAGMSAVGAFFGASNERSSLRSQANIAEINARIAEDNARNIIRAGTIEESRVKLRGAQAKGSQIAQMGSANIDIAGSPTALARLTGNDLITEVDANTTRVNALRAAWGQRIEGGNMRRSAASLRATASGISPLMAGATSLINSAGSVAQSWYTMNKEGAFDAAPRRDGSVSVETDSLLENWPSLRGDFGRMPYGGRSRLPINQEGYGY